MSQSRSRIVVELSEEEAALTRQAIRSLSSAIYENASGEEFEDQAYERTRQATAERQMRGLAELEKKFKAANND